MNDPVSIIALVVALIVAGTLIFLVSRKYITVEAIEGADKVLDGIPVIEDSTFAKIRDYSRIAVKTVEQLVKTGVIPREDQARKDAAMNIIENAAKVDGLPYGAAEMDVASSCIEAEVQDLPRNQKPPDGQ